MVEILKSQGSLDLLRENSGLLGQILPRSLGVRIGRRLTPRTMPSLVLGVEICIRGL